MLFNNTCRDILAIAAAMLDGELAYRRATTTRRSPQLRRAIELDDHLPYDEPWGWMQPTRHAYGALLLEQGHVEEAEAVYARRPRPRRHARRACRHPRQRLEPARLPRVPDPARAHRGGREVRPTSTRPRRRRRPDRSPRAPAGR